MVAGVLEYLESLPEAVTTRLFKSPATCLAAFRLLPPLAKNILLSVLFTGEPAPLESIDALVRSSHERIKIDALQALKRMHIVKERLASQTFVVNAVFCESLRCALTSGNLNSLFGMPCEDEDRIADKNFLKTFSKDRWDAILHYMVGSSAEAGPRSVPSDEVLNLLRKSGLMQGSSLHAMVITSGGFQFLLQDLNTQVWTLLLHYLNNSTDKQMDPVDVLNFIFMLGSLELGKAYPVSGLSETQSNMVKDLQNLGLVYLNPKEPLRFYPAALASILTSDTELGDLETGTSNVVSPKGMIIIETNYRIYAYTESALQISILALFCQLKSRFSNLVIGRISRESIRSALSKGITAAQINQYLGTHAHEQMREAMQGSLLPPTVADQIKLWQLEMDRFRATTGFLYREFPSVKEYNLIVSYAQDMGALVWKNDTKRMFFVDRESNGQVLDYINRKMN